MDKRVKKLQNLSSSAKAMEFCKKPSNSARTVKFCEIDRVWLPLALKIAL